jgi:saccharopine dehydrogenase-like NADP-dependent oxidoreductase
MRLLRDTGLLAREPMAVGAAMVAPLDLTARLLFPLWQMEEGDEDFTVMRILVEGRKDRRPQRFGFNLLDRYDRASGTSSMARTTGYTCTAVARLVASGRYRRPGIAPPEFLGREPGCWPFVRAELARRGVLFSMD